MIEIPWNQDRNFDLQIYIDVLDPIPVRVCVCVCVCVLPAGPLTNKQFSHTSRVS